jgi:hypothetical protein
MATLDKKKVCNVTNNTGVNVTILAPVTDEYPGSPNTKKVYGKNMEILELIDASASDIKVLGDVLNNQSTGSVYLDQFYLDENKKEQYSLLYDLLPSTTNWFFPVGDYSIMQNFISETYPAQTFTSDQKDSFVNTEGFIQTITAYPNSKLTQDYMNALDTTQSNAQSAANGSAGSANKVASTITDSVNNFFKNTQSYQNLTLESVTSVQNYYNIFPYIWAQYQDSVTYYLYGTNNTFQGTLVLKKKDIDVTQENGGYDCTFYPAKDPKDTKSVDVDTSKGVKLIYSNGLFSDNAEVSQVALKGTFMLKRTFTQKPEDTQILKVISGDVYGTKVIGDTDNSSESVLKRIWDDVYSAGSYVFSKIETLIGLWMMYDFVATKIKEMKKKAEEKEAEKKSDDASMDKKEYDEDSKELDQIGKEQIDKNVNDLGIDSKSLPDSFEKLSEPMKDASVGFRENMDALNLQDGLGKQAANLEVMGEYEGSMSSQDLQKLEENATSIKESYNKIDQGLKDQDTQDLGKVIKEQQENFKDITQNTSEIAESIDKDVTKEQKEQIEENQKDSEEVQEKIEESEKQEKENEENDDPKSEGEKVPIDE